MYISEHQWILEGDERRFMESKWLCVLSQYVPEINAGNINQCVVCGGVIGSNWPDGSSILPYCCWSMVGGIGSNPIRTFRRTAICGNSFTYSQKFCEWHTLVFESQAQNRVHVETASNSLRQPSSELPEGGV